MIKPNHHILVCASFRVSGEAQGVCAKKGSHSLVAYMEGEIGDRDMDNVMVSTTGCLKVCDNGPAMVVYPEGTWYGGVDSEDAVDAILDAIEEGGVAEDYVISE